jgi:hypothetical protein
MAFTILFSTNKLLNEIPVGSLKIPLYINQNIHNETLVTLDIKDFINLLKETYDKEEKS